MYNNTQGKGARRAEYVSKTNEIMVRMFNVAQKLEEKAIREASAHDLSIREIHILEAIGIGRAQAMSQVAEVLQIQVSTLTTAINKLVKKSYVERFRVHWDRRIVKIKLTEHGELALREHEEFHRSMIENALQELEEAEIEKFLSSLDNINDFMDMQMAKPIRNPEDFSLGPINIGKYQVPSGIFQGGMGIGIAGNSLATAVSIEGGLGVVAAAEIGFREPDYLHNRIEANKRALSREIEKIKKAVENVKGRGPIGVNIPCNVSPIEYGKYIEVAIEAGAEIIVSGAGLPLSLPGFCVGKDIGLIPVVSSVRATRIIFKNWEKKHGRKPDGIIFENVFAGGQLGYKETQISKGSGNYYKTISDIKEEIGNIPLIVAGGILNRSDAKKAFVYGADGIQMGSRFVTSHECDAPMDFKNAYLHCKSKDITLVNNPGNMPWRVIENQFVKSINQEEKIDITAKLIEVARGNISNGIVFCGSRVGELHKIESVREIMREMREC